MPTVTYVASAGEAQVVEVDSGASAMDGAIWNLVPGIDGDCGGFATCGTCRVFVHAEWAEQVGPATDAAEVELLTEMEGAPGEICRLACQIRISAALDGLALRIPRRQT